MSYLLSVLWRRDRRAMNRTVLDLSINETGIISELPVDFELPLLEIGFMIGASVTLIKIAPLEDPIYIVVNATHLIIR